MSEFDCMTAPLTGRIFVEASAGTGKTYAIEHVVLRLIDTLPLDAILVTTFTRAGVRDLKQRLYETLKRNIDEAPIYTIHGFCHRMLSEYAFESGMSLSSIDPNKGFHKEGTERAILDTLRTLDDLTPAELKRLMAPFHRETAAFVKKMIQYLSSHPIIPQRPSHPLPPYVDLRPLAPFYNKVCNREKEIHPFVEKQLVAWEAGDTETLIQTTPSIFDLFTEGNAKKGAPFIDLRAGRDWLRASDPFVLFQHVAIKVQRLLKERNEGPNILLEAMLEALDNHSFLQQVEGRFALIGM